MGCSSLPVTVLPIWRVILHLHIYPCSLQFKFCMQGKKPPPVFGKSHPPPPPPPPHTHTLLAFGSSSVLKFFNSETIIVILANGKWESLLNNGVSKNVSRWYNFLSSQKNFKQRPVYLPSTNKQQVFKIGLLLNIPTLNLNLETFVPISSVHLYPLHLYICTHFIILDALMLGCLLL